MIRALMALLLSFLISVVYAAILLKGDITFGYMQQNNGYQTEMPALYIAFV
jgi:hypothetical protein